MGDIASSISPTCGNIMHDGKCWRCQANEITRGKKWRTGDHGGKRTERMTADRPAPQMGRLFSQALNGTWKSLQRDVTITINTRTRTYRSSHPKKEKETIHRFFLIEENGSKVRFLKDDLPVNVRIDNAGIVRMKAGDLELGFLYEHDGSRFRTCPSCFAKIPTTVINCDECEWSFGSAFG